MKKIAVILLSVLIVSLPGLCLGQEVISLTRIMPLPKETVILDNPYTSQIYWDSSTLVILADAEGSPFFRYDKYAGWAMPTTGAPLVLDLTALMQSFNETRSVVALLCGIDQIRCMVESSEIPSPTGYFVIGIYDTGNIEYISSYRQRIWGADLDGWSGLQLSPTFIIYPTSGATNISFNVVIHTRNVSSPYGSRYYAGRFYVYGYVVE